jgi:steroid delta-isomerase-like uncharacterized protein
MSAEQNKSIVYRWVEQAWNHGDFSSAAALYVPTYQLHDDTAPVPVNSPDALAEFIKTFRRAMPDLRMTVEQLIAEGEMVAWRFRVTGTQTAELLGIPPTNRPVSISGTVTSRFQNGQWAEDYANWDVYSMLRQLGAIPENAA